LRHLYINALIKMIFLPRQALDKHRESSTQKVVGRFLTHQVYGNLPR